MKKTLFSLALVTALAGSAFAMGGGCPDCGGGQGGMMQGKDGGKMAPQKGMHQGGGDMMGMPMLQNLNLTDDQRHKLAVFQSEMKLEMTKLHDPKMKTKMQEMFTADSFDKKEFIKMQNEMHEKMVTLRANHMEKVFNLLTKEQRLELKNNTMAKKPEAPKQ